MGRTTVTQMLLSGSSYGRRIKVVATGTPGTTIHTATNATDQLDKIYLYATNQDAADVVLTIEWGGVSVPDDLITRTIPAKAGDYLIVAGLLLQNGYVVSAFASVANKITIAGYVERATEE